MFQNHLWIECLVTHPGTADGGITMIEYAVRLSANAGFKGVVYLGAAYENAKQFYKKIGFEETGRSISEEVEKGESYEYPEMKLEPETKKVVWTTTRNGWAAKKFDDRPFLWS
jgi:hypothetical protein